MAEDVVEKFIPHFEQIQLAEKKIVEAMLNKTPIGLALNTENGKIEMVGDSYSDITSYVQTINFHIQTIEFGVANHNKMLNKDK